MLSTQRPNAWREWLVSSCGGRDLERTSAELRRYDAGGYFIEALPEHLRLPLPDEAQMPYWRSLEGLESTAVLGALGQAFPQLFFPVEAGLSARHSAYLQAVRRGQYPQSALPETAASLHVRCRASHGGAFPIIDCEAREDFEWLAQCLIFRNEPVPIPAEVGAYYVGGLTNWARVYQRWEESAPGRAPSAQSWPPFLRRIAIERTSYQSRFVLVSQVPYAGLSGAAFGLEESDWLARSKILRCEHESIHYVSRRLFGRIRQHLIDELMAEYAGLWAAFGRFEASAFRRVMGLSENGSVEAPARATLYTGTPVLDEETARVARQLIVRAAHHLEQIDHTLGLDGTDPAQRCLHAIAIGLLGWRLALPLADATRAMTEILHRSRRLLVFGPLPES